MANYRLRPKARDDLRSIRRWIARDNPVRAVSYITELNQHFHKLVALRLRHEVRRELGDDVRIAVHGNYNIYFRFIGPNLENVQIIRVINAAMNVDDGDLE